MVISVSTIWAEREEKGERKSWWEVGKKKMTIDGKFRMSNFDLWLITLPWKQMKSALLLSCQHVCQTSA